MNISAALHLASRGAWREETAGDLAERQARAVESFHAAAENAIRMAAEAAAVIGRTREMRLDATRQRDIVLRERQALAERTAQQAAESREPLLHGRTRRVVIAHRNEWFRDTLTALLAEEGIGVAASVDNGADAVGTAVAEQPDLLMVEDRLVMLRGEEVIREAVRFCPDTNIAAHVAEADRFDAMFAAGAHAVFSRRVPPVDVARELASMLG